MGAVIANAIFDAVGARVLQLPMTPERVMAAMKAATLTLSLGLVGRAG